MMPSPDPAPAAAVVVCDAGGAVVAAGEGWSALAAVLGTVPGRGPAWLGEVAARLAAGETMVVREDVGADGTPIRSEHERAVGDGAGTLVVSRYRVAERPRPAGPGLAAQRLADVLRLAAEWLYETDADLVLTYVSDRVFDHLGALPAELVGQPLPELAVFDGGPAVFADQLDPNRRPPFADRMADMRHANGQVRRIRFSGVPMFADGRFLGYRGLARDETRQQSAQESAMRAEARLTVGLAASRDGFAIFDSDGLLVAANPQIAFDLGRREPLPPGIELGKLLNHALKTGWFVDTDAPSLAATRPGLSDPSGGQSMIEITLADGRRVLFTATRTDCNDVLLVSTDITAFAGGKADREPLRRTA
jgi:PAS domain-containing protein